MPGDETIKCCVQPLVGCVRTSTVCTLLSFWALTKWKSGSPRSQRNTVGRLVGRSIGRSDWVPFSLYIYIKWNNIRTTRTQQFDQEWMRNIMSIPSTHRQSVRMYSRTHCTSDAVRFCFLFGVERQRQPNKQEIHFCRFLFMRIEEYWNPIRGFLCPLLCGYVCV